MKTIEDFFEEVEEYCDVLESRSSETIHTDEYEETVKEIYADWQEIKISLQPLIDDEVVDHIDEEFSALLRESRKSRSDANKSANCLHTIENEYVEYIYPEVSYREIEAGFINSLVADLGQIEEDKYHEYMEEAILCVQAGAYRGAVVLGWQAGMYALYKSLKNHNDPIRVSYQKKFNSSPDFNITSFWSFQKLQDSNILILAEDVSLIDKSLKDMMDREKDIRNKAAHPGVYDVGPNGTKALLETVMQLLVELGY